MIEPTNGRVVLFTPAPYDELSGFRSSHGAKPMAAHVCHVWGPRMVNVLVIDPDGHTHRRTSVTLVQDGDHAPTGQNYVEWPKIAPKKHEVSGGLDNALKQELAQGPKDIMK